ncbi:LuxR C-terminal-related transcriptional regulator [Amycolatopsis sp. NPDC049868]|uniref:helix-turn-helix domain-containing protein n=1 Tax=Amycolatopsis sp. NPDC049868 TaxID=3363934 RepID=UPI0037BB763A
MRAQAGESITTLSDRETEVLVLIAGDKTDRAIARELGIGERTVRAHVSRILLKLGVASRVGAAVAATRMGLTAQDHHNG